MPKDREEFSRDTFLPTQPVRKPRRLAGPGHLVDEATQIQKELLLQRLGAVSFGLGMRRLGTIHHSYIISFWNAPHKADHSDGGHSLTLRVDFCLIATVA